MRRGSTPIVVLDFTVDSLGDIAEEYYHDGDIFQNCDVYVTIDQNGNQVTRSTFDDDGTVTFAPIYDDDDETERIGTRIFVFLSQQDTLNLDVGRAEVQVRWIQSDGTAHVSDISAITITRVLLEEVILHG